MSWHFYQRDFWLQAWGLRFERAKYLFQLAQGLFNQHIKLGDIVFRGVAAQLQPRATDGNTLFIQHVCFCLSIFALCCRSSRGPLMTHTDEGTDTEFHVEIENVFMFFFFNEAN